MGFFKRRKKETKEKDDTSYKEVNINKLLEKSAKSFKFPDNLNELYSEDDIELINIKEDWEYIKGEVSTTVLDSNFFSHLALKIGPIATREKSFDEYAFFHRKNKYYFDEIIFKQVFRRDRRKPETVTKIEGLEKHYLYMRDCILELIDEVHEAREYNSNLKKQEVYNSIVNNDIFLEY